MIKSLFYSLILHFFMFLFVFCNYLINRSFVKSSLNMVETGISYNFFDTNKIKTTDKSLYEQLDLAAKLNLYNLAKNFRDSNGSIANIPIDSLKDVIGFNFDMSRVNLANPVANRVINAFENGYFSDPTITSNDVIYLGPTDYKILLASNSNNIPTNLAKNGEYVIDSDIKKPKNRENKTFEVDVDRIFTEKDIKLLKEKWGERYDNEVLSRREKISIQNQFAICYKNAISKTKKQSKFNVVVVLNINRNCFIDTNNIKIEPVASRDNYTDSEYEDTINNVRLAIDYCNPIRNLPLGKYDSWKRIKFEFSGE